MKATERYFPAVLFIVLYKIFLTFETVNEIFKCDRTNENRRAIKQYSRLVLFSSGYFAK